MYIACYIVQLHTPIKVLHNHNKFVGKILHYHSMAYITWLHACIHRQCGNDQLIWMFNYSIVIMITWIFNYSVAVYVLLQFRTAWVQQWVRFQWPRWSLKQWGQLCVGVGVGEGIIIYPIIGNNHISRHTSHAWMHCQATYSTMWKDLTCTTSWSLLNHSRSLIGPVSIPCLNYSKPAVWKQFRAHLTGA